VYGLVSARTLASPLRFEADHYRHIVSRMQEENYGGYITQRKQQGPLSALPLWLSRFRGFFIALAPKSFGSFCSRPLSNPY